MRVDVTADDYRGVTVYPEFLPVMNFISYSDLGTNTQFCILVPGKMQRDSMNTSNVLSLINKKLMISETEAVQIITGSAS